MKPALPIARSERTKSAGMDRMLSRGICYGRTCEEMLNDALISGAMKNEVSAGLSYVGPPTNDWKLLTARLF
jgi:hypothetical protein